MFLYYYTGLVKIKNELSDAEFNVHVHRSIVVVNNLEEGLINCDLLIVIGTVNRQVLFKFLMESKSFDTVKNRTREPRSASLTQ